MAPPTTEHDTTSAPTQTNIAGIPVGLAGPQDEPGREAEVPASPRRNKAADKTTASPPSRFSLRLSATWWRSLQYVGMTAHFMAPPRPPAPSFTRTTPSTLSTKHKGGTIAMHFYTPAGYSSTSSDGTLYPAVVNCHGGGFVLGAGTDDARFGRVVTETAGAVFVSVDYRLAPEHAFPTAVDDAADALLYVIRHASSLSIDPLRLATSGFSAGGNLCLTSLLRLGEFKTNETSEPLPAHRIVATAAWYPIVDYTLSRAERRATCKRPDQALPSVFTDLFDASYLYPPDLDRTDPLLSPSQATDERLARDLPPVVLFYTCEWDMLLQEGEDLARRLARAPIGKDVHYKMIPGVPHAWDKSPSPLNPAPGAEELYRECCARLKVVFEGDGKTV